jgi:hypothetical protein
MSPEQLFPRPTQQFLALLAGLPEHLDAAMPMRRQHRRELPADIRELSHLLTDERGDLRRDYLADPAALSAYLRYFLPWNIFRLGVLFAGLALDPAEGATVVDLGAGPLTVPLALWMSRPHLRKRALHFVCVDRAPKPMRLGLDALTHMAGGPEKLAPWRVTLVKAPLDARLREKADLLIMANALNEVLHRGEGELLEGADALAWHLSSMLTAAGQILMVEPGVRPSAHLLAALRRGLMSHGLNPLAPCPHTGPCPMSGRGYTAWCHFNFESDSAPRWLKDLSQAARLPKENVSLSFLHFAAKGRNLAAGEGKSLVRAVSGAFDLPGSLPDEQKRYGQYACSEHGLTLLSLPRKHMVPLPGTLIEAAWPEQPAKDAKSGALILPLGHAPASGEAPAPQPAPKPAGKPAAKPASKPVAKPAPKPAPKPAAKPAGKTAAKTTPQPARAPKPKSPRKGPSAAAAPQTRRPARPRRKDS